MGFLRRPCSSREAFPIGETSPLSSSLFLSSWANYPCLSSARAHPLPGGAPQPLLGNSDTTANRSRWQVSQGYFRCSGAGCGPAKGNQSRKVKAPPVMSGALDFKRGHWPPRITMIAVFNSPLLAPGRLLSWEIRLWLRSRRVPLSWGRHFSGGLIITGAIALCNHYAVWSCPSIQVLADGQIKRCTTILEYTAPITTKIRIGLALATRTIVGAAARHYHPPYRRSAFKARLSRPLVNAMFELEESPHALCIHVV